jgi:hypothetical protein
MLGQAKVIRDELAKFFAEALAPRAGQVAS